VPAYAYAVLITGWGIWALPFLLVRGKRQAAAHVDKRARWGILLQAVAYGLLWQGHFWRGSLPGWRFSFALLFLLLANALSWNSVLALGRHWRVDAGLSSDHELITAGAYRYIRHPIYCSMLCLLLGTGFMITPWLLFTVSTVLFIAGTEIRVHIEDNLLASRFGDSFREYQQRVSAYVPLLR
jgi:protein-S-isoprenylcysteine O-methyltransferase Ste14